MSYHEYISNATLHYLMQRYPAHTPGWLEAFGEEVCRLEKMWGVTVQGYERDSRFGAILYGSSNIYGDVAMKIVPWFSPRLKGEVYCYQHLPYREMCPLYAVDDQLGAMLLKYVPAAETEDPACKEATLAALYDQRSKATAEDKTHVPRYEAVLADVADNAMAVIGETGDPGYAHLAESIARAREAMVRFDGEERCLIHGDAHAFNLLEAEASCLMIDPLGYVAPFAFEWARYLGTAIKAADVPVDEFCAMVQRLSQDRIPLEDVLAAFAIDTTLRACNTFIEGNTREEICLAADWAMRAWRYFDAISHT